MFCEPGAKLSRKSLKNPRHTIPVDQIKVIKGHETFTVVNNLRFFVGVMVMKAASHRGNKFLTVDMNAYVFKWEVTVDIGGIRDGINQRVFGKCVASAVGFSSSDKSK
jgi:hypothetical protein